MSLKKKPVSCPWCKAPAFEHPILPNEDGTTVAVMVKACVFFRCGTVFNIHSQEAVRAVGCLNLVEEFRDFYGKPLSAKPVNYKGGWGD